MLLFQVAYETLPRPWLNSIRSREAFNPTPRHAQFDPERYFFAAKAAFTRTLGYPYAAHTTVPDAPSRRGASFVQTAQSRRPPHTPSRHTN